MLRRYTPYVHDFCVLWETQRGTVWNDGYGDQIPSTLHFMRDHGFLLDDLKRHADCKHLTWMKEGRDENARPEYLDLDPVKLGLVEPDYDAYNDEQQRMHDEMIDTQEREAAERYMSGN